MRRSKIESIFSYKTWQEYHKARIKFEIGEKAFKQKTKEEKETIQRVSYNVWHWNSPGLGFKLKVLNYKMPFFEDGKIHYDSPKMMTLIEAVKPLLMADEDNSSAEKAASIWMKHVSEPVRQAYIEQMKEEKIRQKRVAEMRAKGY